MSTIEQKQCDLCGILSPTGKAPTRIEKMRWATLLINKMYYENRSYDYPTIDICDKCIDRGTILELIAAIRDKYGDKHPYGIVNCGGKIRRAL